MRPLQVALASVAAMGCVEVEVIAPSVCIGADAIELEVPWVGELPPEMHDEPIALDTEIVQDEMSDVPAGVMAEVVFFEGLLAPIDGEGTLEFVQSARVSLRSATAHSRLPQVDLLGFERGEGDDAPDVVIKGLGEAVDLARYLTDGGAAFEIELTGDAALVPERVVFDADLCFGASLGFEHSWLPAAGATVTE